MRVCTCATCVAIAASLTLPLADNGYPHAHNTSPAEQVATIGSATVARSTRSALAARLVHRSWTPSPEATDAPHPR